MKAPYAPAIDHLRGSRVNAGNRVKCAVAPANDAFPCEFIPWEVK